MKCNKKRLRKTKGLRGKTVSDRLTTIREREKIIKEKKACGSG